MLILGTTEYFILVIQTKPQKHHSSRQVWKTKNSQTKKSKSERKNYFEDVFFILLRESASIKTALLLPSYTMKAKRKLLGFIKLSEN